MLSEAAVTRELLAKLRQVGITLPHDRAEAIASDYVGLHQQVLLIRDACPPDASLPLGFTSKRARSEA